MFGISLTEIMLIATIALVVVGPQKLPGMLLTLGQWIRKLRKLTTEVRAQTGIDEILREEGIDGVHELRSLLRGEIRAARQQQTPPVEDPYLSAVDFDSGREYPPEGVDTYQAIPDDLMEPEDEAKNLPVIDAALPGEAKSGPAPAAEPPTRSSAQSPNPQPASGKTS